MLVLLVCFLLSLIYGAGSVLFLTWNASVWGVVFAYFALESSTFGSLAVFFSTIVQYIPHIGAEAIAYISASIVGGVISKAVIREKVNSDKFKHIMTDALIFLFIAFILILIGGLIEASLM